MTDHSRAIQYLLGRLPDAEAEALGEQMFASDETFSRLEDAENTLVEAYLGGELSPDDRARFESLFGASTHLQERLELERALRARLGGARQPRAGVRWLPWAAAIALGVTGGGLALRENRQAAQDRAAGASRERTLEARVAEQDGRLRVLEQRLADHGPAIETWPLTGGSQRASGGAATFAVSGGLIRLRVSAEGAPAGATYRARLAVPEGGVLAEVNGLTVVTESGRTFVDVVVSGGQLPHGTYILSLTRVGPTGRQELGPYSFTVRTR